MAEFSRIQVFFRFDDISALSSLHFEKKLCEVFCQQKSVCSVGVVPMVTNGNFEDPAATGNTALPDEKKEFLQYAIAQNAFDVLMHGCTHQAITRCTMPSEFAGLSCDEQDSLLRNGKQVLEEAVAGVVEGFIPPWNTYDINTLNALKQLGFKGISANLEGPVSDGLDYVQYTTGIQGLSDAIKRAREKGVGGIVGVLLHPCDFSEFDGDKGILTLDELANEVSWLKKQADIVVLSITQMMADRSIDVGASRCRANKAGFWESIDPPFVEKRRGTHVYLSSKEASGQKRTRLGLVCLFYGVILALGWVLSGFVWIISNQFTLSPIVPVVFLTTIGGLLFARWIRDKIIYFKPFFLLVLVLGCGCGVLLKVLQG